MSDLAALHAIVRGHVQGVFFRAFTVRQATQLGLTGYVRNLPDGDKVEVHAEGERKKLEKLIVSLKVGPPGARVEQVTTRWSEHSGRFAHFDIRY
ncbi:MAG: acylphosphatase [Chloroflexi bacterium]|nr:acylphosphatase [Chloroflexota bacterium]